MDRAMDLAKEAKLNDTDSAVQLRYVGAFDSEPGLFHEDETRFFLK